MMIIITGNRHSHTFITRDTQTETRRLGSVFVFFFVLYVHRGHYS